MGALLVWLLPSFSKKILFIFSFVSVEMVLRLRSLIAINQYFLLDSPYLSSEFLGTVFLASWL
uniref:Uncharacterized protein n=1 Tax=Nelumbo nucifera TaxID=4432 RepID=A0A822YY24_NELNU|nr:TPA_asm: hypothetical protein HUJ06_006725 [Nelumbo nucifera]